jgi:LysR family transcriptional regulator, low CO2-responsive transcriptional regulator
MDIDQLRTFLVVVEQGSFTRAGQALGIGQSTVSFHIRALEETAGARLLDRRGGAVAVTAAGKLLVRYARRITALRDEALDRLRAEEAGETGHVTIAASTIPAEYLLPELLAGYRRAHPRVAVRIDVSDSRRALAALLAHEVDIALVGYRPRDRRLVCARFAEDEVIAVAAAGHGDLETAPLILREEGSGTQAAVAGLIVRAGADRPAPLRVGSSEAAKRSALAGLGIAFLSRRAAAEELQAGRLVVLPLPGTPVRRGFWAARVRAATPPAAARALWSLLVRR